MGTKGGKSQRETLSHQHQACKSSSHGQRATAGCLGPDVESLVIPIIHDTPEATFQRMGKMWKKGDRDTISLKIECSRNKWISTLLEWYLWLFICLKKINPDLLICWPQISGSSRKFFSCTNNICRSMKQFWKQISSICYSWLFFFSLYLPWAKLPSGLFFLPTVFHPLGTLK